MTDDELFTIDPDARDDAGHLIRSLHGVTLAMILEALVARFGWAGLAARVPLNCFSINPSHPSSLKFLRRTPWARAKVEDLYVAMRLEDVARQKARQC